MQHIERILVPTDFGAASDAALRYARAIAAQLVVRRRVHEIRDDEKAPLAGAAVRD